MEPWTKTSSRILCRWLLCFILFVAAVGRRLGRCFKDAVTYGRRLREDCPTTGRTPTSLKRMTMVVSEPDLDGGQRAAVTRVLSWCLRLGLDYVFAFDPSGALKANADVIAEELRGNNPALSLSTRSGWSVAPDDWTVPANADGAVHGAAAVPVVHFLDKDDALRPLLCVASNTQSAKNGAEGYKGLEDAERYWTTNLSLESLRKQIAEACGEAAVMEPDVICVIGPVFSLAGCPPWHSRFSEVYYLGRLGEIKFDGFCSALKRYWQTRQRFGA